MDENLKRMKKKIKIKSFSHLRGVFVFRVAFCIIFYLTCTTPSLWIVHVETANRKLYRLAENKLNARAVALSKHTYLPNSSLHLHLPFPTTTPLILSIGHIECHDKVISKKIILKYCNDSLFRHGTTSRNNVGLMQFKKLYLLFYQSDVYLSVLII
jgi:hypothetical protein